MPEPTHNIRDEIDQKLNSLLDECDPTDHMDETQAGFVQSPDHASRLEQLRSVDRLLLSEFGEFTARSAPALPTPATTTVSRLPLLAVAAMLLVGVAVWMHLPSSLPSTSYSNRIIEVAVLYSQTTEDFIPDVVCDTPAKFVDYTEKALGTVVAARFDTDVDLVGWKSDSYEVGNETEEAPPRPRVLLAIAPTGERLVVLFTPYIDAELVDSVTPNGVELSVHSKRLGDVMIHEISTLSEAYVLELLSAGR